MSRKLEEKNLIIASHNAGKIEEDYAMLSALGIELSCAVSLKLPEPLEIGATYFENALIKAKSCCD